MNTTSTNGHHGKTQLSDALRWALDAMQSPAMASADWLAMDIDPQVNTAAELLANPAITLDQIRKAKSVFKTMRIVGETSADRRVGARMYVASIAAGLVRFRTRVSRQSSRAIAKGLQGLLDDMRMPEDLRKLAGMAMCVINDRQTLKHDEVVGHNGAEDDTLPLLDDED